MLMENCWKFPTVVEKKGRKKHPTATKTDKETQPLPSPCISEPRAPIGQFFMAIPSGGIMQASTRDTALITWIPEQQQLQPLWW